MAISTFDECKASFPSDDFLQKYFGDNVLHPYNFGETWLHTWVRLDIQKVLIILPKHIFSSQVRRTNTEAQVYVFDNGEYSEIVKRALEHTELEEILQDDAMADLCAECLQWHHKGVFLPMQEVWWQWRVTTDSLWLETIPEMIAEGQHMGTLNEILHDPR